MGVEAVVLAVSNPRMEGVYRFHCPTCLELISKPADRTIVALLISAGVDLADPANEQDVHPSMLSNEPLDDEDEEEVEEGEPPAWAEVRPDGPAFTADDVITFHFQLEDDAWLARALRTS